MKNTRRLVARRSAVVLLIATASIAARGQTPAFKAGEWPTYGADLKSTRYSALDQINASNFNKLTLAWKLRTDNLGPRPEFKSQSTPLMVNGTLYVTAGSRRAVVSLDPTNSEMRWMFSLNEG